MMYLRDDEIEPDRVSQGDIFADFPSVYFSAPQYAILREEEDGWRGHDETELDDAWSEDELVLVRARRQKIIIVSQTCDIHEEGIPNLLLNEQQQYKMPFILYAPVVPLEQTRLNAEALKRAKAQQALQFFYLEAYPEKGLTESLVFLNHISSILKSRVNRFETFPPNKRIASLRSPYREALASKLGYLFSRVALPSPVPVTFTP